MNPLNTACSNSTTSFQSAAGQHRSINSKTGDGAQQGQPNPTLREINDRTMIIQFPYSIRSAAWIAKAAWLRVQSRRLMKQIMVRILYQIRDEGGRAYNKSFVYFMNEHMDKIQSNSDVYQLLLSATDGDEVNNSSRWLHGIDHFQEVFRVLFYQEDI
jgi:hypothetical protein